MIAICVGHSRQGDKGAVSIGGVTEWDYNREVARHMQEALQCVGIASRIMDDYPRRTYQAAIDWLAGELRTMRAIAAIELHFNAATPQANGHEWLHWPGSARGQSLARQLAREVGAAWPDIRPRGLRETRTGRGSYFLRRTPCPAVITEPFFGSNLADWRAFGGAHKELGQAYARAVTAWISGG
jgi:N-acetylmuramoyl-L-alanine amidase